MHPRLHLFNQSVCCALVAVTLQAQTSVAFKATVRAGEVYTHPIGHGLYFTLDQLDGGDWNFQVKSSNNSKDSYTDCLGSPFLHGPATTDLTAWRFVPEADPVWAEHSPSRKQFGFCHHRDVLWSVLHGRACKSVCLCLAQRHRLLTRKRYVHPLRKPVGLAHETRSGGPASLTDSLLLPQGEEGDAMAYGNESFATSESYLNGIEVPHEVFERKWIMIARVALEPEDVAEWEGAQAADMAGCVPPIDLQKPVPLRP
jgi:hypothetical protein